MGGCCSAGRRAEEDREPIYYYYPQTLDGHEHLSFTHITSPTAPSGLYLNASLQSPYPDSYQAQYPPQPLLNRGAKANQMPKDDSQMVDRFEVSDRCESLKCSEYMGERVGGKDSVKPNEDDEPLHITKTNALDTSVTEEDVCPTCLDEYDSENPRIITKCKHHFHLSCILEWMERSDTCPICDKIMMID